MSLKDLELRQSYESDCGNLIELFYEPVLSNASKYFRLAGFFSSSSLAIAARGLAKFISNEGKFFLVCNPLLSKEDAAIIKASPDSSLNNLSLDLNNIQGEFERNHVKALGWMLSKGILEIKLAVLYDDSGTPITADRVSQFGIFHQKVGIVQDKEGNSISFSGSINESATAWLNNDEEFKVFRSWDQTKTYVDQDMKRFQAYWCDDKIKTKVFNIPEAIKNDLIRFSSDFEVETLAVKEFVNNRSLHNKEEQINRIHLFFYQEKALNKWIENNYSLLFEMATGTGKTRTAIACISHLLQKQKRICAIVSCPQSTLARQWGKEILELKVKFDEQIIVDSTNPKWHQSLHEAALKLNNGFIDNLLILTTHASSSKEKFVSLVKFISDNTDIMFIGDETHWLGAGKFKNALLPQYKYRVGLSATPSRWFDDFGSSLLVNYYGSNNFEFGIADALSTINPLTQKTFLVNFMYHLIDVKLNDEEGNEYKNLTQKLIRLKSKKDISEKHETIYQNLLMKRADIVKNAYSKYSALEKLLDQLEQQNALEDLIIFVSPQQKDKVKEILISKNIRSHELTEKQGTVRKSEYGGLSEREHILECFKKGSYKVLVAIKCLDEGIDIPSASRGILMASSTNPREYIQRIGRIIRQSPGKMRAYLYDMTVLGCEFLSEEEKKMEAFLRKKEITRIREISKNALNSYDAELIINKYNQWL